MYRIMLSSIDAASIRAGTNHKFSAVFLYFSSRLVPIANTAKHAAPTASRLRRSGSIHSRLK